MMRSCLRIVGIAILVIVVGFLLGQLIPYGHTHTNPPVVKEPNWDSPTTRALAKRACFDCHSNETTWPWYSNVAPISWLVVHDTQEGRGRLNFSNWQGPQAQGGGGGEGEGRRRTNAEEIAKVIQEGSMPPWYYILEHPSAALTDQEKQQLITGLQATLCSLLLLFTRRCWRQ